MRRAARLRDANPGAPDAYIVYGDALSAAGRDGDAAQAYARAANVRFSEDVALRLVSAWQRAGQANRALQVVSLFLEQNPQSIAVNRMAARVRMDLGDWQGALDALSLIEAKTGRQDALLMADMAWALSKLGKNDKALAYAAYAYRLQPASPVTADVLGWQLLQTGKDKQAAVDLLEKAVALTPDNPLLNYHLGTAYAASGRKDDARRVLALAANDAGFSGRGEAKAMLARL